LKMMSSAAGVKSVMGNERRVSHRGTEIRKEHREEISEQASLRLYIK